MCSRCGNQKGGKVYICGRAGEKEEERCEECVRIVYVTDLEKLRIKNGYYDFTKSSFAPKKTK